MLERLLELIHTWSNTSSGAWSVSYFGQSIAQLSHLNSTVLKGVKGVCVTLKAVLDFLILFSSLSLLLSVMWKDSKVHNTKQPVLVASILHRGSPYFEYKTDAVQCFQHSASSVHIYLLQNKNIKFLFFLLYFYYFHVFLRKLP